MRFKWKPSGVFYGWWIVTASFLIALYVDGIAFYGFTAIFEPIANELGWSYTQVSVAASLRGLEMGLLAPLVGILTDRWGPRRMIFLGAVFAAIGLIFLSNITSLGMFYGAFALIAIGTSGCHMTVLMTAVTSWFREKAGIANGIAVCGFGFSGFLVPVIVMLIGMYGWRMTMTILSLGMLAIVLPLSLLFRHKPEQYGYLPDGQVESPSVLEKDPDLPQANEVDFGAKQALKSSIFWRIVLAFIYHIFIISAIFTHIMPYLSSIGVARTSSSLVATVLSLVSIGGRLGLGRLGDKVDSRWVVATALAMIGLGTLCFGCVSIAGTWLLLPFIVLYGIGYGGCMVLRPSLVIKYFGRTNFGTIFGLMMGINLLGSIIGPPLAGWVYDSYGSYQGIWSIFAGLSIVAIISVLTIPPARTAAKLADKV